MNHITKENVHLYDAHKGSVQESSAGLKLKIHITLILKCECEIQPMETASNLSLKVLVAAQKVTTKR